MTPEALQKLREEVRREREEFKNVLLRDIPYFHRRFARTKDPQNLEIAKNLGIYLTNIK